MKLKVTNKGKNTYKKQEPPKPQEEPKKTAKKSGKSKLPSDKYKPMFEPTRLLVKETPRDGDMIKQYIEFKVQRANDEYGLPNVYLQGYQESNRYTGYQKGRTIVFPLEALYEVIDYLNDLSDECDKRHIEY